MSNQEIGIDTNWFLFGRTGVSRYARELTRALLRTHPEQHYRLYGNFLNHYTARKQRLQELISESGNKKTTIDISPIPAAWRDWLIHHRVPLRWFYRQTSSIYFTSFFSGVADRGFAPQVVVLYDLVFLKYPEHAGARRSAYYLLRTKQAIGKAAKIITISEATKQDLVSDLQVDPQKITVIYPGLDHNLFQPRPDQQAVAKKYGLRPPYLLSVATLEPRKDLSSLLEAYLGLPTQLRKRYQLVLVGDKGWNTSHLQAQIRQLSEEGSVIWTGFVPDQDLPFLYSGAEAFIYPSLYEGFGLPVIEAMACGAPVIARDVSSLPEAVGRAGLLIASSGTEPLRQGIRLLLMDKALREQYRAAGFSQAQKFTWDRAGQAVFDLLNPL